MSHPPRSRRYKDSPSGRAEVERDGCGGERHERKTRRPTVRSALDLPYTPQIPCHLLYTVNGVS